jgi:hypothetical protein
MITISYEERSEDNNSSKRDGLNPFIVKSFCSVVTKEVMREGHILATSINMLYGDTPILFFCDRESFVYLHKLVIKNLKLVIVDFKKPEKVLELNSYHKSDAILRKMDVMLFAIKAYGNSVFLDADIILLKKINGPDHCEVGLSLNLCEGSDFCERLLRDGIFNVGIVYSDSLSFVSWWKAQYVSGKSKFYEQECLNRIYEKDFHVGFIDNSHNHGFWRGADLNNRDLSSIHCHLDLNFINNIKDEWIKKNIINFRRSAYNYIEKNYNDLFKIIIKILS